MKKDPGVFLGHILDSIELIESYSRGKDRVGFDGISWLAGSDHQKDRDNR